MLLRKDDPWLDDLPVPDIRDWRVVDESGDTIGFVQSLVVDAGAMKLEAVLTGANDRYPADEIDVAENTVRVRKRLERREGQAPQTCPEESRGFLAAYRDHHARSYDGDGVPFDALSAAYRFGRERALDADYARRSFLRAEEDVRAEYVSRRLRPPFALARPAVEFGYNLIQQLYRYDPSGMERADRQIMTAEGGAQASTRAGSPMDTGTPLGSE